MAATPADLMSPWALFMHADAVVKAVMIGLLLASVWTWGIIFSHAIRLRKINRATEAYEQDFWAAKDIDAFHEKRGDEPIPSARIVSAGLTEWRRSIAIKSADRSGARERLTTVMNAEVASELDRLSDRLNILATVASAAPFIGLFGTVWGHHAKLHRHCGDQQYVARRRRAGHRRGFVRDRGRPVRGHSCADCV
jgi:biopolymer transport protein TolQ